MDSIDTIKDKARDTAGRIRKPEFRQRLMQLAGFNSQSPYVKDYFYNTNMRASVYMSVLVIVLEIWMIIRRIRKEIERLPLFGKQDFEYYFERFKNYGLLLIAGICMLTVAVMYIKGKLRSKAAGEAVKLIFSFICVYFGIMVSIADYSTGEQILTFLTMELFTCCLLVWRPWVGFLILTGSYLYFYHEINEMVARNLGTVGASDGTKINLFTMWLATILFCVSNYNKTMSQATKDEHLEEMNSYLSKISVEDELTGIHNMVWFRSEAQKLLSYVTTDRENIVFLFLDIENFKSYNEQYGFQEGSELLKRFAHMLEEAFEGSLVSRFSDDHFVVLTRDEGSRETVAELAEKIAAMQGEEVRLTLKCGAYKPTDQDTDPSQACDRARFACNFIKKHFDLNYKLYDKNLEDKFELRQHIVNSIDTAVEQGCIKVYYQPVISTRTGKVCGLEALARWLDPQYGLLPPGAFVGILEEYRQIHKLDRCITEQVCRDFRENLDAGRTPVPVSLNFSRLDFELCDIVGFLDEMSRKYHVPREYLDIEVTESALADQQDFLKDAMTELRAAGHKIWLDDFGSGYSSLNVLKDYRFDVLKIDMMFLTGFAENVKSKPILENIVSLTKQLDMVSLTEGVETREQYDFLKSIGCDRAQGFLFSKPVTKQRLLELEEEGKIAFPVETA